MFFQKSFLMFERLHKIHPRGQKTPEPRTRRPANDNVVRIGFRPFRFGVLSARRETTRGGSSVNGGKIIIQWPVVGKKKKKLHRKPEARRNRPTDVRFNNIPKEETKPWQMSCKRLIGRCSGVWWLGGGGRRRVTGACGGDNTDLFFIFQPPSPPPPCSGTRGDGEFSKLLLRRHRRTSTRTVPRNRKHNLSAQNSDRN